MANNKQILVLEDDVHIREIITDIFEGEGYGVVGTGNGAKGLELLGKQTFDLIILDMNLLDMNGNVFLTRLTKAKLSTKVVVVSANSNKLTPHPNVKGVVPKPFDVDVLLEVVENLL